MNSRLYRFSVETPVELARACLMMTAAPLPMSSALMPSNWSWLLTVTRMTLAVGCMVVGAGEGYSVGAMVGAQVVGCRVGPAHEFVLSLYTDPTATLPSMPLEILPQTTCSQHARAQ